MKNYTFLLLAFIFSLPLFSQNKIDNNWMFGLGTGIDAPQGNYLMHFNTEQVDFTLSDSPMKFFRASSIVSDKEGELLFYSNGCHINNKNGEIMDNGDELEVGAEVGGYCTGGENTHGSPIGQSVMTLPFPKNDSLYAVFQTPFNYFVNEEGYGYFYGYALNLSVININENDGLGKVIEKNVSIVEDTLILSKMTAVKHANNDDWWIMIPVRNRPEYMTLLLTSEGVTGPFYQEIGEEIPIFENQTSGQGLFSPDGTKYVWYSKPSQIQLFDFDRETGQLSNHRRINYLPQDSIVFGGNAFSSNSRFLYVSNQFELYQVDTDAEDIEASVQLIANFIQNDEIDLIRSDFYLMQLAPDCRIYMNSTNGSETMHVIDKPNEPGAACNFVQRGLQLPKQNPISLPIYPNYRLGTDYAFCDSTITVPLMYPSSVYNFTNSLAYRFHPNPATHYLTVENLDGFGKDTEWELHDLSGRTVQKESLSQGGVSQQIELNGVPGGLYFQTVREAGALIWRARVVVTE